ncbi:histone-lysine N-methyltransferase set1-like isoform X2 [Sparus aurata]|uniref:histone-lysine N-methyltransferase set1-like isoform X2 n=1 Tax=Sparus aurata TaxID=8175 RepID=UPI0011C16353|nr:histone-lysine N-methyltransferase set1-like isoform X2 [Sparus aurata]
MVLLTALTEEVRELRGERESYRRELTALSEELQEKERATWALKEQLDSYPDHNQDPVSPTENHQDPPTQHPPSTPSTISSSQSKTTPRPSTSPQINTTPHPSRPAQQREKPDIVILIDSNGKFINEKKLFPTHTVAKIWCPNTQHAMDLLSEERLGSPSHIIIHTGSNDLRSQQERVSGSLRRVIEKASTSFPNSRVVMSTLLPRKDFHPDTIHRINSSMSRDCVLRPNVHLAHHPTLDVNCLYDHVHLFKNKVPIFARTLKDVALNRDQSTPHRRSSSTHNPLRPTRPPTGPPTRQPQWRPDHPHLPSHHVPLRPHQSSYNPPQTRPEPLLPPRVPRQPQRQELHPSPLSYAQAVRRAAGHTLTTPPAPEPTTTPPHNELRDIQQMLGLLCSHLIGSEVLCFWP